MFTWLKKSLTLALLLCFSSFAFGVTFVSPQNRINIWEGPNAIPRSSYSIGSTTVMGEVLTLQSNALVTGILSNRNYTTNTGGLDFTRTPGAFLSSVAIPGYGNRLHQRLSDNYGSLGQCVAFARSMTSAGKSNTWWAGKTIGSYLTWNGVGYRLDSTSNMLNPLKPGTMIAYFRGQSQYPQNPSSAWDAGHVAIFLSWVYDQNNYIIGMKVIDENLVPTVSNASGLSGLIQKHMLPIVCPSGQNCTNTDGKYNLRYIATSYNVVDVRWQYFFLILSRPLWRDFFCLLPFSHILSYMFVTPYFILILVPIFFSFLFFPFWFIIGESLSFERMKVYALIILVSFGIVEVCVRYMFDRWDIRKRVDPWFLQYGVYLLGILIFPIVVGWFSFSGLDIPFFWGSHEKRHGYIFFVSILLTFFLFSLASDKRRYYRASLMVASVVAVIAILEYIGFSLFLPELSTQSWGVGRSVSTLGNPNYVAGYLLMHLPFLSLIHRKKYRIFFLFLLIGGIMTTGSLIGSILTLLFLGVYFFRKSYLKMSGIALAFLWMIIFSYWLPHDKMLSFESRFVLMYETLSPLFSNVRHFLFGFGPDAIIEYFQWYRNTILNTYFPSNMNIDSSHNMFIDIAFQYGFIALSGLIFFLVRRYRHLSDFERQTFWLGSIFFSLNVIVIAPILIFVIILSYGGKLEK